MITPTHVRWRNIGKEGECTGGPEWICAAIPLQVGWNAVKIQAGFDSQETNPIIAEIYRVKPGISVIPADAAVGSGVTLNITGEAPNSSVEISFTDPSGVLYRNVRVTTDSEGNVSWLWNISANTVTGEWTVKAKDINTGAIISASIQVGVQPDYPPVPPDLELPVAGETVYTGDVAFYWSVVPDAYRYHLMICRDGALTIGCVNPDMGMVGVEPLPGMTSVTVALGAGAFYWSVRSIREQEHDGWGQYASPRYLVVSDANRTGIPDAVTWRRVYHYADSDGCYACANNDDAIPQNQCVPTGIELTHQESMNTSELPGKYSGIYNCNYISNDNRWECWNAAKPRAPVLNCYYNLITEKMVCIKNHLCDYKDGTGDERICKNQIDDTPSEKNMSCTKRAGIGIEIIVPSGEYGTSGYDTGIWPYEPKRPAFKENTYLYVHARMYIEPNSGVVGRIGVDCTPTLDPDLKIITYHSNSVSGPGWHDLYLPYDRAEGSWKMDKVIPTHRNCSAWAQCLSAGQWPDHDGDSSGGKCVISDLEIAGYLETCNLSSDDFVIEVDGCETCKLGHNMTADNAWSYPMSGVFTAGKMTWTFPAGSILGQCLRERVNPSVFNICEDSDGTCVIDSMYDDDGIEHARVSRNVTFKRIRNGSTIFSQLMDCSFISKNVVQSSGYQGWFVEPVS